MSPCCDVHPERPAIAVCTRCDAEVCGACHGTDLRGFAVCQVCRERIVGQQLPGVPWETPQASTTTAFLRTLARALRHPRLFPVQLITSAPDRSSVPALLYGMLCHSLGAMGAMIWTFLLTPGLNNALREAFGPNVPLPLLRGLSFLSIPLVAAMTLFVQIVCLQVAVRLAGGQARWPLTTRIVCYASSAYLFGLIPPIFGFPLGQMLAVIWLLNLEFSALQHLYRMPPIRSVLASTAAFLAAMIALGGAGL